MRIAETLRATRAFLVRLFVAAFALNWLWEMLQMPAYVKTAGSTWAETWLICTLVSVGDGVITLGIYGVVMLAARRSSWLRNGKAIYALAALLGALCGLLIEWAALAAGAWAYAERMPCVFGAGLLPLVQVALLVPAAMWIAVWWSNRAASQNEGIKV